MRKSMLGNYIIPGLTSSLLTNGVVRLFEASREQHSDITPHSHRFNFTCLVLRGHVVNRLWTLGASKEHDWYAPSKLEYSGAPGSYKIVHAHDAKRWRYDEVTYNKGEWYSMVADQIHSIMFSPDAIVLFFEGPQITDTTTILEPVVDRCRVSTFAVQPWMFSPVEPI
jgi:hypothetical protein